MAIRYLLANGANDSILGPQGYDALTLAVLHAGRKRLWELDGLNWDDVDIGHLIQAEQAAIELLRHAVKTRGYKIQCDLHQDRADFISFSGLPWISELYQSDF